MRYLRALNAFDANRAQEWVQWVGGRWLEVEVSVESAGVAMECVHESARTPTISDASTERRRASGSRFLPRALLLAVHCQARQQNHRYRFGHVAPHLASDVAVLDAGRGQRVVANNSTIAGGDEQRAARWTWLASARLRRYSSRRRSPLSKALISSSSAIRRGRLYSLTPR